MASLSQDVRNKLLAQRASIGHRDALFIDNKHLTRIVLRVLPGLDGMPGVQATEIFSESLKKGATSPATHGQPCPIRDYLDNAKKKLTKEENETLRSLMKMSEKFVLAVIDMADPGTADSPTIRLFNAVPTLYDKILAFMADDDAGDDITDYDEGRNITITRTDKAGKVSWDVAKFSDRCPLSDDPAYTDKVREIMQTFDVRDKLYKVDWPRLNEIYHAATGDNIPASYMEGGEEVTTPVAASRPSPRVAAPAPKAAPAAPKLAAAKPPARPAPRPAPAPAPEPEQPTEGEADANGIILGVTRVSFEYVAEDQQTYTAEGVVSAINAEDADKYDVVDNEGAPWTMAPADMTILEEPAAEPEPAPAPAPRAPIARTAAPKPAAAAPAAKPPAGKMPLKPASATSQLARRRP